MNLAIHPDLYTAFLLLLVLAVILVPLFHRLGLGSILAYLLIGALLGSSGIGLIQETKVFSDLASLGVIAFLFVIGLEISPSELWNVRRFLLGLGALQVFAVSLVLFLVFHYLFALEAIESLVLGMGLSLSSTAFALNWLNEHGMMRNTTGKAALGVLLFQDIIVALMITIVELSGSLKTGGDLDFLSLLFGLSKVALMALALYLAFRFVVPKLMRIITNTGIHEIFTATTLFLLLGTAKLAELSGLSLALGAFIAGLFLAESPFRHALQSNIEPFKGLFLGFFFVLTGATIDFPILKEAPYDIMLIVSTLLFVKFVVLLGLGFIFKIKTSGVLLLATLLAQGGEFAYVLFQQASGYGLIEKTMFQEAGVAVAISLLLSPFLLIFMNRVVIPFQMRFVGKKESESKDEETKLSLKKHLENQDEGSIIILGGGRFGGLVMRFLIATGIRPVVIDNNPEQIELLRRYQFPAFYGDATNLSLLLHAGGKKATAFILAQSEENKSKEITHMLQENFPEAKIFARVGGRSGALQMLQEKNVIHIERDILRGSLNLGEKVLVYLGMDPHKAKKLNEYFIEHDNELLHMQHQWAQENKKLQKESFFESTQNKQYIQRSLNELSIMEQALHDLSQQQPENIEDYWEKSKEEPPLSSNEKEGNKES